MFLRCPIIPIYTYTGINGSDNPNAIGYVDTFYTTSIIIISEHISNQNVQTNLINYPISSTGVYLVNVCLILLCESLTNNMVIDLINAHLAVGNSGETHTNGQCEFKLVGTTFKTTGGYGNTMTYTFSNVLIVTNDNITQEQVIYVSCASSTTDVLSLQTSSSIRVTRIG